MPLNFAGSFHPISIMSSGQNKRYGNIDIQGHLEQIMCYFSFSNMLADGSALFSSEPSVGTVMSKSTTVYARHRLSIVVASPEGRFKNVHKLVNLGDIKSSLLNKLHIFQCMGKIFFVEFQRVPLKFHTKYLTHTLKDTIFIQWWKFNSSQIYKHVCVFEMPLCI